MLFESITSVEVQLELEVGDARIRQLGVEWVQGIRHEFNLKFFCILIFCLLIVWVHSESVELLQLPYQRTLLASCARCPSEHPRGTFHRCTLHLLVSSHDLLALASKWTQSRWCLLEFCTCVQNSAELLSGKHVWRRSHWARISQMGHCPSNFGACWADPWDHRSSC